MYLTLQNPKLRIQNALKIGWSAILFIAIWLGISFSVWAQPQYNFTAVSGTFTPITGGTDINNIEADEAISTNRAIGFSFTYNGIAYTQFRASSNGFMTFSTTATNSAVNNLSGATAARRPLLAPLWDDLDGTATGTSKASFVTTGVAGSRIFTMEWLNWEWSWNSTAPVISFQVKLYEADGAIEYIYRQEAAAVTSTTIGIFGASIGLTTATGTGANSYLSLSGSGSNPTVSSSTENSLITTKPATGQVYRFTPKLFTTSPTDNATGVSLTSNLVVTFLSGTPAIGTGNIQIKKTSDDSVVETIDITSAQVTIAGQVITIDPSVLLDCNTEYYVNVDATTVTGVTGFAGVTNTTDWSFTTTAPVGTPTNIVNLIDENFDADVIIPTSWTNNIIAGAPNEIWDLYTGLAGFTGNFPLFDSDGFGNNGTAENVALESPVFDASTVGRNYTLSFKHYFEGGFGGGYNVEVFNGTTWTSVLSGTVTVGSGTAPVTANIDITTVTGGHAAAQVRFRWTGNWSNYWAVDEVKVSSSIPQLPLTATFSPVDEATGVALNANLVLDFPYPVSAGIGDITIYDVTTSTVLETIPVGDARVTFSGGQVTINPSLNLPSNTLVAVQFPTGTFVSCNNLDIIGIIDNTTWNFTTVDCSSLTIDAGVDQFVNPNTLVSLNAVAVGADAAATYSWTPTTGLSDSTIANPTIANLTATTTYTVTVTNPNGCQASDDVLITSNCDALLIDAGSAQSVASNSMVTFAGTATGGSGNYAYSWSPGVGLSDSTVSNPTFAGFTVATTFTLTVTDLTTGCVKTDNVVIGITPPSGGGGGAVTPTVTAPLLRVTSVNSTSIRLNWSGSNATQYLVFRKGGTSTNFALLLSTSTNASTLLDSMLMPNTHYSYYVQAVISGVTANSNIASDYTYPSKPTVVSFQNACLGTGAQLTIKGSTGVYNVYSSATGGTAVVSGDSTRLINTPTFADSTTFYVSAIGTRYESMPRVAVHVITRPLPTATMLGATLQESCTDMLTIMAQAVEGATYTWYSSDVPLATTSTPMYTVNRSGLYSVLVNKEGCVARSTTIRVRVNVITPAKIIGLANRQFCEVGTLEAIQTDSAMYEWQRDNTVVGTGSSLEVTQSGNYTVTVTSSLGCVLNSESVSVTVISIPQLDLQTSDSVFCSNSEGVELTVNAVSGATYEWLRNGRRMRTTSIPSLQVNTGGEYRVRVLLNETCSRTSDPVTVTRKDAPSANTRLYGDSIKVVYVGNVAIQSITWTKDDAPFSATTRAFVPTESGLYQATITYTTGCVVVSSGINYIKSPEVVTGEEDVEALGFMLFPNPTASKVNVAFGDAFKGEITLKLTDAIGRTIQVVKVTATENAILDLSAVANGTYMLTIASKDKVVTRKIIRE